MTEQKKATKVNFERKKPAQTVKDLLRRARVLKGQDGSAEAPSDRSASEAKRP